MDHGYLSGGARRISPDSNTQQEEHSSSGNIFSVLDRLVDKYDSSFRHNSRQHVLGNKAKVSSLLRTLFSFFTLKGFLGSCGAHSATSSVEHSSSMSEKAEFHVELLKTLFDEMIHNLYHAFSTVASVDNDAYHLS